ncbi:hypothetical protein ACH5RR_040261 [Cinchona calisaya]|uniref:Uncharacterized protein n=1 Tax=Cinchona calisaya TaxID=153742 RepID=A0ABD2XTN2_9GENT
MEKDSNSTKTAFFLHSFGRNNFNINVNFISTTFQSFHFPRLLRDPTSYSSHSIFTFIAEVLVNFLQLKYQNKNDSPFETHPKTMYFAITSLLLYCLAYDAKSRFSCNFFSKCCMGFFGSLSLASLLSVLFPRPLCPVLFLLSILCSFNGFPCSEFVIFWKWMEGGKWLEMVLAERQQKQQGRRRLSLGGSVYAYGRLENVIMVEEDILLPV